MQTVTMGSLNVRIVGGTDGQGGGTGPAVVLMHGFGAPGTDLIQLANYLEAPAGTRFVFPEAPLELPLPMMGGRAWWMIDIERIQRAMMTGEVRNLRKEEPAGLQDANRAVVGMLDALDEALKPSKVVLGGFSQGAMLTLDVALTTERSFAGVILLSGTFIAEQRWAAAMAKRAGLPVYQSHGTMDPVLPYVIANELHEALKAAGVPATFVPFTGGHEIGAAALAGANRFLKDVL